MHGSVQKRQTWKKQDIPYHAPNAGLPPRLQQTQMGARGVATSSHVCRVDRPSTSIQESVRVRGRPGPCVPPAEGSAVSGPARLSPVQPVTCHRWLDGDDVRPAPWLGYTHVSSARVMCTYRASCLHMLYARYACTRVELRPDIGQARIDEEAMSYTAGARDGEGPARLHSAGATGAHHSTSAAGDARASGAVCEPHDGGRPLRMGQGA